MKIQKANSYFSKKLIFLRLGIPQVILWKCFIRVPLVNLHVVLNPLIYSLFYRGEGEDLKRHKERKGKEQLRKTARENEEANIKPCMQAFKVDTLKP